MKRILFAALLALVALPALAQQQPTQAQMEAFRNLPPAEQERLMREHGGMGTSPYQAPARLPQDPLYQQPMWTFVDPSQLADYEHRAEPGDTLAIQISGDVPGALSGRRLVIVDSEGYIRLPAVDRILVAGLRVEEIGTRLRTEQILATARIDIQVLPVRKAGLAGLRPFGYSLFQEPPTTFAPTAAVPVPSDYRLGPGDILNVQTFGQQAGFYGLEVTREGQVLFPQLGPVSVAGMTFDEARSLLMRRVEEQMIGVRVSITMGPLRTMRVFVLGEAAQPGAYTISALSTATHALFTSGGVHQQGSLRSIEIKRNGETIAHLDLYDLLLRGDTRNDVRLQADDVIFIPPVGTQAAVDGAVRRPAIYELKNERTLNELVQLAGGALPTAFLPFTRIERVNPQTGERGLLTLDLSEQPGQATRLRAGDYVSIASVLDRMDGMVRLTGHVHRPLVREFREGLRVSNLIPNISVLQSQPDLEYALLRREVGPTRRVEIEAVSLAHILAEPHGVHDLPLQANDELIVFGLGEANERRLRINRLLDTLALQTNVSEPFQSVIITGRVRVDGRYPMEPGMRVSALIRAGGGLSESAFALEAEITRRRIVEGDEQVIEHFVVDLQRALAGDPEADVRLQPRDLVSIRMKPNWGTAQNIVLRGEVRFPGEYAFRNGETLATIIDRAGGLTGDSYPAGAVFMREELRRREQQQIDAMTERMQADILSARLGADGDNLAQQLSVAQALVGQLQQTRATGRMVIDLDKVIARAGDLTHDIEVENGDTLVIPRQPQSVTIIGEVHYPTSHFWESGMPMRSYLNRSGGMTVRADRRHIYIVRVNGAVEPVVNQRRAPAIQPGDTIVVPLDAERIPRLLFWTNISQIFYQIGVAAAAWRTVGVF